MIWKKFTDEKPEHGKMVLLNKFPSKHVYISNTNNKICAFANEEWNGEDIQFTHWAYVELPEEEG